jgi:hypothetical protein
LTENPNNDLEVIKRLLILQALYSGATIRDIKKVTGMGADRLYKFIPKNIDRTKKRSMKNDKE